MTNEELLQITLNSTIERLGKQATAYESEIANLNAQITLLNIRIQELVEKRPIDAN
jgi:prefoldin subunit 5